MRVQSIDTTTNHVKIVGFDDVINSLVAKADGKPDRVDRISVNHRLLSNETIKSGNHVFKRVVETNFNNGGDGRHFNGRYKW